MNIKKKLYYTKINFLITFKKIFFLSRSVFRLLYLKLSFQKLDENDFKEIHNEIDKKKNDALIFMPEGIFTSHLEMSKSLESELRKKFNVKFICCNNNLVQCMHKMNMSAYWWLKNKFFRDIQLVADCNKCLKNFKKKIKTDYFNLKDLNDDNLIAEYKKIENSNYQYLINDYLYQDIPLGKLVKYDLSIVFKKNRIDENFTNYEELFLKKQIKNNVQIINYLNIIKKKFDFNYLFLIDEYSSQTSIRLWCAKNNVNTYIYQYTYSNDKVLELTNVITWPLRIDNYKKFWDEWKNIPINKNVINSIFQNLISRTQSKAGHVFSKSFKKGYSLKIFEKSEINKETKIYGLFTSSDDEQLAKSMNFENFNIFDYRKNEDVFKDQNDWIEKTINFFENLHTNSKLIIVIHPRLAKSLNFPIHSSSIKKLESKYRKKNFKNVKFIWPDLNISTYNIIETIDAAIVSWSSIGIEMSLLGIPTITALQKEFQITPNFNGIKVAKNEEEYFSFFNNDHRVVKKNLIESLRWFNLITNGNSVHNQFSSNYETSEAVLRHVLNNKDLLENNLKFFKKNLTEKKQKEELLTIKKNIESLKRHFLKKENPSKLCIRFDELYRQLSEN
jgi:hypothetical protein